MAENTVLLDFSRTRYRGLEVRVRPDMLTVDGWLEFWDEAEMAKRQNAFDELAWFIGRGVIADWNAERGGEPIPVSADRVRDIPAALARRIVSETLRLGGGEIDLPLDGQSPGGDTSEAG